MTLTLRNGKLRIAFLAAAVLAVTVAHFSVGTVTHRLHVVHVFLRTLYLLIIIASTIWFGLRGGLVSSVVISVLFGFHIFICWADDPMENINQEAMIGVYLLLGSVSGVLVESQNREKERRIESERHAQREAIIQGFAGLSHALKARDQYTREHSQNVADLAVRLGRKHGLAPHKVEDLRLAALVHDIGKIGVRDDILFKPDRLSPEERESMKQHPELAAEILQPIKGTSRIAEIVMAHHECPDGSGYPRGLKSDEIPEESKVLSVADVFCAMTENRPYKKGMQSEKAFQIVQSMAGEKLDAECVMELEKVLRETVGGSETSSVTED